MKVAAKINRILHGAGSAAAQLILPVLGLGVYVAPIIGGALGVLAIADRIEEATNGGLWVRIPFLATSYLFCAGYVWPVLAPRLSKAADALFDKSLFPDSD